MKLSRLTRLYVWLRLLLCQCSWNYERFQGLGFFYALLPGLKKIYNAEQLKSRGLQHDRYFNTHPYLAPLVAGVVLRLEQDNSQLDEDEQIDIEDFKEMVAAPCAAIGDALFWGGGRPLAAGITLLLAVKGILWAPLVYLVLYNVVPLLFRVLLFRRGYSCGFEAFNFIQRFNLPDWAIRTKESAIVVLGGLSAFLVFNQLNLSELPLWSGFAVLPAMIALGGAARKGLSTLWLVLLTVGTIIIVALFRTEVVRLLT